jgi:hypothetical protein
MIMLPPGLLMRMEKVIFLVMITSDLLPDATVTNVLQEASRTPLTCSPREEVKSFMSRLTFGNIRLYFIE